MKRVGEGVRDLPYDRYESALVHAKRMRSTNAGKRPVQRAQAGAIDLGTWEPLGPGNQGGRTPLLIIHPTDPKIMYAGAATGGVWKTTDAGLNWRPLTDTFPSLGIGALTFDPKDPNTIYAGTGFWFSSLSVTNVFGSAPRGGGILRSRDAGETWEKLPGSDGLFFRYITEVIVSHNDSNHIYASTWGGVFRSLDAGQTWQLIVDRSTTGTNGCQDMAIRRDMATDYLFAACGTVVSSNPGILRNTDAAGDGKWEVVFSNRAMGNTTLAIAPSNPSTIYALVASNGDDNNGAWRSSLLGVWRSTTNGDPETWEERVTNQDPIALNTSILSSNSSFFSNVCGNTPRSIAGQGWIHNAIAVDPADPDRVYVGGIDIYRSDDGGRNWGIASFWQAADGPNGAHADVMGLVFPPDYNPASNDRIYAATDGGVYVSDNSRAELATGQRAACSPLSNQVRWRPLHGGYQSTQFYTGAVAPGGGAFFGGKQDNGTMRGTLWGKGEWTRLRGGDGAAVALDRRNPNTLFVSTQNFGLTRSRNAGATLLSTVRGLAESTANFAFIAPLAMDPSDSNRLYAGGRILHRTIDQADNWVPISTQMPTAQGYVSAVAVAPSDPTRVVYGTNAGFLFRTDNALEANSSTEWQFSRPRPGYIPAITFDPNNADIVYAVYSQFNTAPGQNHVYRSTDGGRTWEGIDRQGDIGIPDMPVLGVTVDPLDSNRIYLGTDLGVFVSTDNGESWMRDQSPFANVPTEALVIDRSAGNSYLYAFTFGRGVWRSLLPGSSGTQCNFRLNGATPSSTAYGFDSTLNLATGEGCVWTVIPSSAGLAVPNPTGTGPSAIGYSVLPNTGSTPRTMTLTVQDQRVSILQSGATSVPLAANLVTTPAVIATLPAVTFLDSRSATASAGDPQPSCASLPPAKTVWYRVIAPSNGDMEVVFQGQRYDVFGNSGLVVSAYSSTNGTPNTELGCGSQERNTSEYVFKRFRFPVQAGATYLIQASATGSAPQDGGYTVVGVNLFN
jgi:photosystem II stability/assembly factor-like uncharacterized protein